MSNYTQTNIYRKQMQDLGLNTKQYAELIEIPYEVVKDIIYDKEGDYSMEIKDLLRTAMFNKHQEIENDYENAKIKATQIRNDINYLKWYNTEYTLELLKEKLHLHSIKQFIDNYTLKTNGKIASYWTYQLLLSKREYAGHQIEKNKKLEFIKQLYDILVNDNSNAYHKTMTKEINKTTSTKIKQTTNVLKWFKNFDFKKYLKENDMSRTDLANRCDINYTTLCHLINKGKKATYETEIMRKVYNYINNVNEDNRLSDTLMKYKEIQDNQPIIIATKEEPKIEIINNDEILRRILINRLTDEEKELIRLFGGKIC